MDTLYFLPSCVSKDKIEIKKPWKRAKRMSRSLGWLMKEEGLWKPERKKHGAIWQWPTKARKGWLGSSFSLSFSTLQLLNGIVTEQLMLAGTFVECLVKAPFSEKKLIQARGKTVQVIRDSLTSPEQTATHSGKPLFNGAWESTGGQIICTRSSYSFLAIHIWPLLEIAYRVIWFLRWTCTSIPVFSCNLTHTRNANPKYSCFTKCK